MPSSHFHGLDAGSVTVLIGESARSVYDSVDSRTDRHYCKSMNGIACYPCTPTGLPIPINTDNAAGANVVCQLARLHWLPVKHGVHFKLAFITFSALTTPQPSSLLSVHIPRRDLPSGNYQWLLIPETNWRAFSHTAPTIWNGLPTSVTSSSTLEHFKRSLKNWTVQSFVWQKLIRDMWFFLVNDY